MHARMSTSLKLNGPINNRLYTVRETNFHQHMIDIIMPNSDSKLANSLITQQLSS